MEQNPYMPPDPRESPKSDNQKNSKFRVLKIVLIALGIVMFLVILLFVWVGVKTTTTYNNLEGKAEPLIEEVLNEQSPWNYATLRPHLSKLWLDSVSEEQSEKLMKLFSKLGKFKSIEKLDWQGCATNTTTEYGSIDRCNYVVFADYENGEAHVFVGVVVEEDSAKIIQIRINSNAFLE